MKELKSREVAYLDKICSPYSFGLVDVRMFYYHLISAGLRFLTKYVAKNLAHELAHILGGQHIINQLIVKPHYVIGNCSCHHLDEEYCVLGEYQL
ncbi:hypothetical protein HZS_2334 [Henneguya salminicola]|nr:hypothetical protein HZS_2334 [Henneguya salminicola]